MTAALRTTNLTKIYDGCSVVDDLDWEVPVGSACAFLGPNGAGKTTTLRMLMGFTQPSRGEARVFGEDAWDVPVETKTRIGYVPENSILPEWMRVDALVDVHRSLYPRWDAKLERELFDLLEVPRVASVGVLSKGQSRRLTLLLALSQGADLLLLDEPGSGLDVAGRRQLLSLLSNHLAEEGRTLVFSTHIVTDVERIANRVTIIREGRRVVDTELDELHENVKTIRMSRAAYERQREAWERTERLSAEIDERTAVLCVRHFSTQGRLVLRDLSEDVVVAQGAAQDSYVGRDGEEAQVIHMPLEDVYLALTETREGATVA